MERHLANLQTDVANVHQRLDNQGHRLDRIERRLELVDSSGYTRPGPHALVHHPRLLLGVPATPRPFRTTNPNALAATSLPTADGIWFRFSHRMTVLVKRGHPMSSNQLSEGGVEPPFTLHSGDRRRTSSPGTLLRCSRADDSPTGLPTAKPAPDANGSRGTAASVQEAVHLRTLPSHSRSDRALP